MPGREDETLENQMPQRPGSSANPPFEPLVSLASIAPRPLRLRVDCPWADYRYSFTTIQTGKRSWESLSTQGGHT